MKVASAPVYRAALGLAARGVAVFPCATGEKRPLTPHGFSDATTDPAVIDRWSRRWPHANLAIATGCRSGLLVIDVDVKHGRDGFAELAKVEQQLGALPATLTAATPSGGEHRYFGVAPVSIRIAAGRIGAIEAPGVDVRGDGGYVLCSPSVVDGRPYVWRPRVPLAELPAAWIDALVPPQRQARSSSYVPPSSAQGARAHERWCSRALQDEARRVAMTSAGSRNDRLWRAASALGGLVHLGAIDSMDVRRALEWACGQWGERSERKDRETIERGLAFGLAHPRTVRLGEANVA